MDAGFFDNLAQGEILEFRRDGEGFNLWRGTRRLWTEPLAGRTRAETARLCMGRVHDLNAALKPLGLSLVFQTAMGEGGRRLRSIAVKWLEGRVPEIDHRYLDGLESIRIAVRQNSG